MQEIEVAAGVVFLDGKLILAQRKKGDALQGMWEFPGGKIEEGESPFDALIRELKEELDIEVTPVRELLVLDYQYPDKKVRLHFILAETKQTPKPVDCQDAKVFRPVEIENLNLAPADEKAWNLLKKMPPITGGHL